MPDSHAVEEADKLKRLEKILRNVLDEEDDDSPNRAELRIEKGSKTWDFDRETLRSFAQEYCVTANQHEVCRQALRLLVIGDVLSIDDLASLLRKARTVTDLRTPWSTRLP